EVAQEGVERADRLAGLLAQQPHPDDPLAEALTLTAQETAVVDRVAERRDPHHGVDAEVVDRDDDEVQDEDRRDVNQVRANPVNPVGILIARYPSVLPLRALILRGAAERGLATAIRGLTSVGRLTAATIRGL